MIQGMNDNGPLSTVDANPYGGTVTGGVIRATVYYYAFQTLANAP